jgi:hypothetical protein
VDVTLEPGSARFASHDDRWLSQVADLVTGLERVPVSRVRRDRPLAGAKGAVTDVIVSLGSAGVFTAVVEVIKLWLGRDSGRTLKLSWSESGKVQTLELSGSELDETGLARLERLIGLASK